MSTTVQNNFKQLTFSHFAKSLLAHQLRAACMEVPETVRQLVNLFVLHEILKTGSLGDGAHHAD